MDPKQIYEALKKKILLLDLTPESVLNLSELAEYFGVSRTPIKEALISLQARGWVLRHGSHFLVTPLSLDRIREITEIRTILELQANLWALERITPRELADLDTLTQEIQSLEDNTNNQQIVELDLKFHRKLYHATQNGQLARMLERLLSHYLRFWLSIPRRIDLEVFFNETLLLIDAFRRSDEAAVRRLTETHIRNSVDEIMGRR